jgi:hypothetical protein
LPSDLLNRHAIGAPQWLAFAAELRLIRRLRGGDITVLGVMMLSACPSPGEPTCECDAAMQPWSGPADALTQPDSVLAVEPIPLEVPLLTGYSANRQAFGQDGAWFGAAAQVGDVDGDRRDDVIIAHGIDWWPQYLTVYTHRPGSSPARHGCPRIRATSTISSSST